jgi:hypothetical protein
MQDTSGALGGLDDSVGAPLELSRSTPLRSRAPSRSTRQTGAWLVLLAPKVIRRRNTVPHAPYQILTTP